MRTLDVHEDHHIYAARTLVRETAVQIGFGPTACAELIIVVSELSTNILKHAKRGRLSVSSVTGEHGPGISIRAEDNGPPFRNMRLAFVDGHDDSGPIDPADLLKRGGLGTGLGAVLRLTDRVEYALTNSGKAIIAIRHLSPQGRRLARVVVR